MQNKLNRKLALLLSILMMISIVNISVFAADETALNDVKVGPGTNSFNLYLSDSTGAKIVDFGDIYKGTSKEIFVIMTDTSGNDITLNMPGAEVLVPDCFTVSGDTAGTGIGKSVASKTVSGVAFTGVKFSSTSTELTFGKQKFLGKFTITPVATLTADTDKLRLQLPTGSMGGRVPAESSKNASINYSEAIVKAVMPKTISAVTATGAVTTTAKVNSTGFTSADRGSLGLPETVNVTYTDTTTGTLPVVWDYALITKDIVTAQTVTGTVTVDGVGILNPTNIKASATVTLNRAVAITTGPQAADNKTKSYAYDSKTEAEVITDLGTTVSVNVTFEGGIVVNYNTVTWAAPTSPAYSKTTEGTYTFTGTLSSTATNAAIVNPATAPKITAAVTVQPNIRNISSVELSNADLTTIQGIFAAKPIKTAAYVITDFTGLPTKVDVKYNSATADQADVTWALDSGFTSNDVTDNYIIGTVLNKKNGVVAFDSVAMTSSGNTNATWINATTFKVKVNLAKATVAAPNGLEDNKMFVIAYEDVNYDTLAKVVTKLDTTAAYSENKLTFEGGFTNIPVIIKWDSATLTKVDDAPVAYSNIAEEKSWTIKGNVDSFKNSTDAAKFTLPVGAQITGTIKIDAQGTKVIDSVEDLDDIAIAIQAANTSPGFTSFSDMTTTINYKIQGKTEVKSEVIGAANEVILEWDKIVTDGVVFNVPGVYEAKVPVKYPETEISAGVLKYDGSATAAKYAIVRVVVNYAAKAASINSDVPVENGVTFAASFPVSVKSNSATAVSGTLYGIVYNGSKVVQVVSAAATANETAANVNLALADVSTITSVRVEFVKSLGVVGDVLLANPVTYSK